MLLHHYETRGGPPPRPHTAGGTITQTNVWGRRRLAYPINNLTEGQYVLFLAQLPAQALAGLEREFRLSEEILRFLIVRVED